MTRHFLKAALAGVCLSALMPMALAKDAPKTPATAQSAPGTEPLNVGETRQQAEEKGDGVAAIVNDSVITDYDLRQRIALVESTSGARTNPDAEKQLHGQILEQLENERLQLLEAQKSNVTVSSSDVDKAIASIIKDNNLTEDKLNAMLAHSGVHMSTLRSQIAAQIAWSKTVQNTYGDRADVTPEEVNDELQRRAQGRDKTHFLTSEIFEAVENPEDDAKIHKNMDDLEVQLRGGAPFASVARQFSQNPTAAQGGDIGVVIDGQLPKELNDALLGMHSGTVSPPIKSAGGYYILYLRARAEGEGTKISDPGKQPDAHPDQLPLQRLLLPLAPKSPKELVQRVVNIATQIRDHVQGCNGLAEISHQVKGSVFMNLGTMRIADLSPEIQQALAQTQGGDVTPPFQSQAGIELIARCDKGPGPKEQAFVMPTRDDIEQQLSNDKLAVLERQYMRDLKRDGDIELPGDEKSKYKKVRADAK